MNLNTIETGSNRIGCAATEIIDNACDLVRFERPRDRHVDESIVQECLGFGLHGRRRYGGLPIRLQVDMRHPANVPELQEDMTALGVNGIRHLSPTVDLRLAVDARRILIALPLLRDLGRLRDDQACRGALCVVFRGQIAWHKPAIRSVARQRSHDDPVGQRESTEYVGFKECLVCHFVTFTKSLPHRN